MKASLRMIVAVLSFAIGASALDVVLPPQARPVEVTARNEIVNYLAKGVASLKVGGVEISAVRLGDTPEAKKAGMSRDGMKEDSFEVRRVGSEILINGGGSRGVLYGAYDFLWRTVRLHYFSPAEIEYRNARSISVDSVDANGGFYFPMRDIYIGLQLPQDGGRFAVSNGLSRDGDRKISVAYGGAFNYGSPYSCHTFDRYIPAAKYLKSNPEYFSLRKGKRIGGMTRGQLCLTNPEVKKLFAEKLLENMRNDAARAKKEGVAAPAIYDVSHNDNGAFCECPACQEIITKENASGYVLQFVNELAALAKKEFPQVKLQTFAYQATLAAPKTVHAADNVIVRVCNTSGDKVFGAPKTPKMVAAMKEWQQFASELYAWDYGIIYGGLNGLPYPSEFHYGEMFRFYAENKTTGMFWELESPDRSDVWELKYFMLSKYMADPFRKDFDELLASFCDEYYGAAGTYIIQWRRLLNEAAMVNRSVLEWVPTIGDFEFITWDVMEKSQKLFEQARQAVAENPKLLYRVNRAAQGLDRMLGYECPRRFLNEFAASGKDKKDFPLDIMAARTRFRENWTESAKRSGPVPKKSVDDLMNRLAKFEQVPVDYPVEPKFADVPHVDVTPGDMPLVLGREMSIVKDEESGIGVALMIDADTNRKTYKFPMTFGMYNKGKARGIVSRVFKKEVFVPEKYQWITVDNILLPPEDNCYLWLTNSWKVQIPLNNLKPLDRSKRITAHIHVKFTGDLYYENGQPSRIYIDRVVITQGTKK